MAIGRDVSEMKLAEERKQRIAEERMREVVTSAPVLCYAMDGDGRITVCEGAGLRALSLKPEQVIGASVFDVFRHQESVLECTCRTLCGEEFSEFQEIGERWYDAHYYPLRDTAGQIVGAGSVAVDITDCRHAEEVSKRVQRALRTLSECNQLLVRATDEGALRQAICRLLVATGGYHFAWLGFVEREGSGPRCVACSGKEDGSLERIASVWTGEGAENSPVGKAIGTGRPSVVANVLLDPDFTPWRAEAEQQGYRSMAALPLQAGGRTLERWPFTRRNRTRSTRKN